MMPLLGVQMLFGMIAAAGIGALMRAGTDMAQSRGWIIVSLILVFGISGIVLEVGDFRLSEIGLTAITGIILHGLLPKSS